MSGGRESRVARRLRELAQWSDEDKAKLVGVSVAKWRTLLRAERRELLTRAVKREK